MSAAGVRPRRQYAVTPVTVNLSGSRVDPNDLSALPARHDTRYQQQLQYEPESAKYFIYRTQMHLQSYSANKTLPRIRSESSNIERSDSDRFSSVEKVAGRFEELLPNIRSFSDVCRQGISRRGSRDNVVYHDNAKEEAEIIRQALELKRFKLHASAPLNTQLDVAVPVRYSPLSDTEEIGTENDREKYPVGSKHYTDSGQAAASVLHQQSELNARQRCMYKMLGYSFVRLLWYSG